MPFLALFALACAGIMRVDEIARADADFVADDVAVQDATAQLEASRRRNEEARATVQRAKEAVVQAEADLDVADANVDAALAELSAARINRDVPRTDAATAALARARAARVAASLARVHARRVIEAREATVETTRVETALHQAELELARVDGLQRIGRGDAYARATFTEQRDDLRRRWEAARTDERRALDAAAAAGRRVEDARRAAGLGPS